MPQPAFQDAPLTADQAKFTDAPLPPPPPAGTWEDKGVGGMVWHPASGTNPELRRVDNQVLGMPPELAVAGALPVARTIASAGAGLAAKASAAAGAVGQIGVAQAKYWATKEALTHLGIPSPLADAAAVVVSGYRKGGSAAEAGPTSTEAANAGFTDTERALREELERSGMSTSQATREVWNRKVAKILTPTPAEPPPPSVPPNTSGTSSTVPVPSNVPLPFKANAPTPPVTTPPATGTGSVTRLNNDPLAFKVDAPPAVVTTPPATGTGSVTRLNNDPLAFKVDAPPAVVTTPPATGTGSVTRVNNEPLAFKVNAPQTRAAAPSVAPATGTGFRVRVSDQPTAFTVQAPAAVEAGVVPAAASQVPKIKITPDDVLEYQSRTAAGEPPSDVTRDIWNRKAASAAQTATGQPAQPGTTAATDQPIRRLNVPQAKPGQTPSPTVAGRQAKAAQADKALHDALGLNEQQRATAVANTDTHQSTQHLDRTQLTDAVKDFTPTELTEVQRLIDVEGRTVWDAVRAVIAKAPK